MQLAGKKILNYLLLSYAWLNYIHIISFNFIWYILRKLKVSLSTVCSTPSNPHRRRRRPCIRLLAISKCVVKGISSLLLKSLETRGRYTTIGETEQSELLLLHIGDSYEDCWNIVSSRLCAFDSILLMLFSPIWDIVSATQNIVLKSNPSMPLHIRSDRTSRKKWFRVELVMVGRTHLFTTNCSDNYVWNVNSNFRN